MARHGTLVPPPGHHWTAEEVRQLPDDGNRYEVVHGELLVTPAPRAVHQSVAGNVYFELRSYLTPLGLGKTVFMSPADISWDDDVLVQPDVFVVAPEQAHGEWSDMKHLLLAVEVLSPSTALYDRNTKRRLYQEYGVEEYWVVDAKLGRVEVWHPSDAVPAVVTDTLTWNPGRGLPPCTIDVQTLLT